jgi:hypothetical protein
MLAGAASSNSTKQNVFVSESPMAKSLVKGIFVSDHIGSYQGYSILKKLDKNNTTYGIAYYKFINMYVLLLRFG